MKIGRKKPIREDVVQCLVKHIFHENGLGARRDTDGDVSDAEYAEAVELTETVMRIATEAERKEASRRVVTGDLSPSPQD